jgi:hypothetical protein
MLHLRTPPSGLRTAPRAHCFLGRFLPKLRRCPHGRRRFWLSHAMRTPLPRARRSLRRRAPRPSRTARLIVVAMRRGKSLLAPIGAREARHSSTETVCKNVDNCIYRHVNRVPPTSLPIRSGEGVIRSRIPGLASRRRLVIPGSRRGDGYELRHGHAGPRLRCSTISF